MALIPFFGIYAANQWINVSTTRNTLLDATDTGFNGQGGIEVAFSQQMSIIGLWNFSFSNPLSTFQISLNFR